MLPPRALAVLLVAAPALLGGAMGLSAAPAQAADPKPFVVIGTSDVFDSKLVTEVIEPGFEAAFPEYDFQYVSKGTGDAIALAETGAGAAIIVHAASLENQFVAEGYSAEGYGRAFTYGDFVLAGRASDAAGVTSAGNPSHDVVDAFQKIAAAGASGKAEFVSRGGTPGTTIAEHAVWAETTGVTLCDVPDGPRGGGKSPSTTTGTCPATISYPSWYHATGANQANNVVAADACNGYASKECYVFTDRGTFNFLESTSPPSLANLVIDVRDNAATAAGGKDILINNFHAYAVDPDKFQAPGKTDLVAATKLLDYLVAPATQDAIDSYLSSAAGGAPFKKSAAPVITASTPQSTVNGGAPVTVSGSIANAVPGTPALDGVPVKLLGVLASTPNAAPTLLNTQPTGAQGQFSFSYTPRATLRYIVATDRISKVERPDLKPVFGDVLQATSEVVGVVGVNGLIGLQKASRVGARRHTLHVEGQLRPGTLGTGAKLRLLIRRAGSQAAFGLAGTQPLAANATSYSKNFVFKASAKGTYDYQLRYTNPDVVQPGSTKTYTVTFPWTSSALTWLMSR